MKIKSIILPVLAFILGCAITSRCSKQLNSITPKVIKIKGGTTLITKTDTATIPGEKIIVHDSIVDTTMVKKYNDLKTENEKLKAYVQLSTTRNYVNDYTSDNGFTKVRVKNTTLGYLTKEDVEITEVDREVVVPEKEVRYTPGFSLSVGPSIQTTPSPFSPKIGVSAGLRFRKSEIDVNINSKDEWMAAYKFDIFTIWTKEKNQ